MIWKVKFLWRNKEQERKRDPNWSLGIVAGLFDSSVGKIFWISETLPRLKKTQSVLKCSENGKCVTILRGRKFSENNGFSLRTSWKEDRSQDFEEE